MTQILKVDPENIDVAAITLAAEKLRAGGLVAFPTETVYGLGANALDSAAIDRIFAAKGRPFSDPLIVHIGSPDELGSIVEAVPEIAHSLTGRFWPGALTLILKRHARIAVNVSAGRETVAVRMPSHPVAQALIQAAGVPVAAPSANLFTRPSPTTAAHVLADLEGRVDIILDGGRTPLGLESTVLDLTAHPPRVLRPGGVPLDALREVVPQVSYEPRYDSDDQEAAPSPGTMLKHYSPEAEVILFTGPLENALAKMLEMAGQLHTGGRRVGILLAEEEFAAFESLPVEVFGLGAAGDLDQIARNLFAGLRELDRRGVAVILAHDFAADGIGLAIHDRLMRAAEGQIIDCA